MTTNVTECQYYHKQIGLIVECVVKHYDNRLASDDGDRNLIGRIVDWITWCLLVCFPDGKAHQGDAHALRMMLDSQRGVNWPSAFRKASSSGRW